MIQQVQVFLIRSSRQLYLALAVLVRDSKEKFGKAVVDQKIPALVRAEVSLSLLETYCRSPDTKSSRVSFGLKSDIRSASFKQSS